ncbi:hypothetical protein FRC12_015707 [Ceratobasidium sp. 428]|nr:hypothetical protein FRC12_015707 [Ceratobasidium sp. 428]
MDPHPCLIELAEAGSASLRAGLVNVPSHERDFLEAWCRDTLTNYASSANTPALSRTPSSLIGMVSSVSPRNFGSAYASTTLLGFPPSDTLVMSPGPNGGHKELMRSIPLDAVLYELEQLLEECKTSTRPLSELLDRPSTPLSFHTTTSSSGTISSIAAPSHSISSSYFQLYSGASLSPMQQLIAQGPIVIKGKRSGGMRSVGRVRAGSFTVRGVV